jgi:hypothetical protein
MTRSRSGLWIIFAVAVIICAWDVYAAVRGQGNNIVAWALGAMMAAFAIWVLSKLMRGDAAL